MLWFFFVAAMSDAATYESLGCTLESSSAPYLSCNSRGITGTLAIDNIPSDVQTISLYGNSIQNIQPGSFAGLSSLSTLDLHNNQLVSLDSNIFAGLSSLSTLYLHSNQLVSLNSSIFAGLSSLSTLYLNSNQLESLDSNSFAGLSSLSTLDLRSNQLVSLNSSSFAGLSSLSTLDLRSNQLVSLDSNIFAGLSSLSVLRLESNQLVSLDSNLFAGLSSLSTLYLGHNQLVSLNSSLFAGLSLLGLSLRNNQLVSLDRGLFAGLSLTTLNLLDNDLTYIDINVGGGELSAVGQDMLFCRVGSQSFGNGLVRCVCLPGFVCLPSGPQICPRGTFQPQSNMQDYSSCLPCQAGSYSSNEGAVVCQRCLPGFFLNHSGLAQEDCAVCPAGHFCPISGTSLPSPCLSGSFSDQLGLVSPYQCQLCPEDKPVSALGSSLAESCTRSGGCEVGFWCNGTESIACTPGTFNAQGGATSITQCLPCPAGSFQSNAGQAGCRMCSHGSFQSDQGQARCRNCSAASSCPAGSSKEGRSELADLVARGQDLVRGDGSVLARGTDGIATLVVVLLAIVLVVVVAVMFVLVARGYMAACGCLTRLDQMAYSHKWADLQFVQRLPTASGGAWTLTFLLVVVLVCVQLSISNTPVTSEVLKPTALAVARAKGDLTFTVQAPGISLDDCRLRAEFAVPSTVPGLSVALTPTDCGLELTCAGCVLSGDGEITLDIPFQYQVLVVSAQTAIPGESRTQTLEAIVQASSPDLVLVTEATLRFAVLETFYEDKTANDRSVETGFLMDFAGVFVAEQDGRDALVTAAHRYRLGLVLQASDVGLYKTKATQQDSWQLGTAMLSTCVAVLGIWKLLFAHVFEPLVARCSSNRAVLADVDRLKKQVVELAPATVDAATPAELNTQQTPVQQLQDQLLQLQQQVQQLQQQRAERCVAM